MRKRNAALGIGALLVAMFGGCAVGAGSASDSAQPPTPTKTVRVPAKTVTVPGPTVTVHDKAKAKAQVHPVDPGATIPGSAGDLRVGSDVKPGTYVTKGNTEGQFCNWQRTGPDGQPIDLGVVTGQAVVTIKATDAVFTTTGCNDWHRS